VHAETQTEADVKIVPLPEYLEMLSRVDATDQESELARKDSEIATKELELASTESELAQVKAALESMTQKFESTRVTFEAALESKGNELESKIAENAKLSDQLKKTTGRVQELEQVCDNPFLVSGTSCSNSAAYCCVSG